MGRKGGSATNDALFCGEMWGSVGHMNARQLTGTHECRLDNRFRLAIPARLRERFADGAMVGWWLDECLVIVPRVDWSPLIERTFGAMSVLDDESREMSRFLSAGAYEQELDKQGRVLLPLSLREYADVDGLVSVVGAHDYLEVWNPERLSERITAFRREGVSARAKRLANRSA
jgi:MraZ protein